MLLNVISILSFMFLSTRKYSLYYKIIVNGRILDHGNVYTANGVRCARVAVALIHFGVSHVVNKAHDFCLHASLFHARLLILLGKEMIRRRTKEQRM